MIIFNKIYIIVLFTVCVILAVLAGTGIVADIFMNPAHNLMRTWKVEKRGSVPNKQVWVQAVSALTTGHKLLPYHARFLEDLGSLHYQRSFAFPSRSSKSKSLLKKAVNYYKQAVLLRPSWGLYWINIAQSEIRLGLRGKNVFKHVKQALLLDPWNPNVQKGAIRIGLILWPKLTVDDKKMVQNVVEKALPRHPYRIIKLVTRFRKERMILPLVKNNPKWYKYMLLWRKRSQ